MYDHLPLPASIARYILSYYGSSLVRYKPEVFNNVSKYETSYLFDALARETPTPMLQDALSGLRDSRQVFRKFHLQ